MSEIATKMPHQYSLDATGLNCPLPILKTKVQLTRMQDGEVIYVTATDPHSKIDFEAYCARSGHELLETRESDGLFEFFIRKAAAASPTP